MKPVTVTATIAAAPDRVYETIIDIERLPETSPDTVSVTFLGEQRSGAGTRFRETRQNGGLLAWTMPGPDGTPASKRLSAQMSRGRRAHIALSVAHGIAMVATVTLGMVSSMATKDTPAWDGTIVAHHAAAAATTTLMLVGVGLRTAF